MESKLKIVYSNGHEEYFEGNEAEGLSVAIREGLEKKLNNIVMHGIGKTEKSIKKTIVIFLKDIIILDLEKEVTKDESC